MTACGMEACCSVFLSYSLLTSFARSVPRPARTQTHNSYKSGKQSFATPALLCGKQSSLLAIRRHSPQDYACSFCLQIIIRTKWAAPARHDKDVTKPLFVLKWQGGDLFEVKPNSRCSHHVSLNSKTKQNDWFWVFRMIINNCSSASVSLWANVAVAVSCSHRCWNVKKGCLCCPPWTILCLFPWPSSPLSALPGICPRPLTFIGVYSLCNSTHIRYGMNACFVRWCVYFYASVQMWWAQRAHSDF